MKHIFMELCAATIVLKAEFKAEIGDRELLHPNPDLWMDKFSTLKYMEVRVFCIIRPCELRRRLSSVRQFTPDSEQLVSPVTEHRKLVNAAPQRWRSVIDVLESLLVNWDAIGIMFGRESRGNPLAERKEEIVEMYSIFKPCTDVIVRCQLTSVPMGTTGLFGLASLKLTTIMLPSLPLELSSSSVMDRGRLRASPRSRLTSLHLQG